MILLPMQIWQGAGPLRAKVVHPGGGLTFVDLVSLPAMQALIRDPQAPTEAEEIQRLKQELAGVKQELEGAKEATTMATIGLHEIEMLRTGDLHTLGYYRKCMRSVLGLGEDNPDPNDWREALKADALRRHNEHQTELKGLRDVLERVLNARDSWKRAALTAMDWPLNGTYSDLDEVVCDAEEKRRISQLVSAAFEEEQRQGVKHRGYLLQLRNAILLPVDAPEPADWAPVVEECIRHAKFMQNLAKQEEEELTAIRQGEEGTYRNYLRRALGLTADVADPTDWEQVVKHFQEQEAASNETYQWKHIAMTAMGLPTDAGTPAIEYREAYDLAKGHCKQVEFLRAEVQAHYKKAIDDLPRPGHVRFDVPTEYADKLFDPSFGDAETGVDWAGAVKHRQELLGLAVHADPWRRAALTAMEMPLDTPHVHSGAVLGLAPERVKYPQRLEARILKLREALCWMLNLPLDTPEADPSDWLQTAQQHVAKQITAQVEQDRVRNKKLADQASQLAKFEREMTRLEGQLTLLRGNHLRVKGENVAMREMIASAASWAKLDPEGSPESILVELVELAEQARRRTP